MGQVYHWIIQVSRDRFNCVKVKKRQECRSIIKWHQMHKKRSLIFSLRAKRDQGSHKQDSALFMAGLPEMQVIDKFGEIFFARIFADTQHHLYQSGYVNNTMRCNVKIILQFINFKHFQSVDILIKTCSLEFWTISGRASFVLL